MSNDTVQMKAITTVQRTVRDPKTGVAERKMIPPGGIFFVDEKEATVLERLGGAKRDTVTPTTGERPISGFTDDEKAAKAEAAKAEKAAKAEAAKAEKAAKAEAAKAEKAEGTEGSEDETGGDDLV